MISKFVSTATNPEDDSILAVTDPVRQSVAWSKISGDYEDSTLIEKFPIVPSGGVSSPPHTLKVLS
jgi:hypothetical protein